MMDALPPVQPATRIVRGDGGSSLGDGAGGDGVGDAPENDTRDHAAAGSLSRKLQREDDLLSGAVSSRGEEADDDTDGGLVEDEEGGDEEDDDYGSYGGGFGDSGFGDSEAGFGPPPSDTPLDQLDGDVGGGSGSGQIPAPTTDGESIAASTIEQVQAAPGEAAAAAEGDGADGEGSSDGGSQSSSGVDDGASAVPEEPSGREPLDQTAPESDEADEADGDDVGGEGVGQLPFTSTKGEPAAAPEEPTEQEAPDEADTDNVTATVEREVIPVPIASPIALAFHCTEGGSKETTVPCDLAHAPELELIEEATEGYLRESSLWESALESDAMASEGVEYRGVELTIGLLALRRRRDRRLAEGALGGNHAGGSNVRRRAAVEKGANVVLLSGTASFGAPTSLSPDDPSIPGQSHLSELLLIILTDNEAEVVDAIRSRAGDARTGSWLGSVAGYDAAFEADLVQPRSVDDPPGDVIAGASESVDDATSGGGNGGVNLLLVIGAAGVTFSLLLLAGVLCYARKSYKAKGSDAEKKGCGDDENLKKKESGKRKEDEAVFQPGKNNPRSAGATSSFFKKKSTSTGALEGPSNMPPPVPLADTGIEADDDDDDNDDDESHEDFLLARAALDHGPGGDDDVSAAAYTLDCDQSYAFTVEGESLAPLGDRSILSGAGRASEDAAIGAGGLASFANDKGVFRWNEEGTKMVYTPNAVQKKGSGEQNGFVFDESKKKWVVKDQVVGEKNVSFQPNPSRESGNISSGSGPPSILRTRSNDSAGTGMTGLTDFSYGDVALDRRRSRSNGTEGSISIMGKSIGVRKKIPTTPPGLPGTPEDQGVEMTAETSASILQVTPGTPGKANRTESFDSSEFAPNTNMDTLLMGTGEDDSVALNDITGSVFAGNSLGKSSAFNGGASYGAPPAVPMSHAITPERSLSRDSGESDTATVRTVGTGDPGRIVPRKPAARPNHMTISEDMPFDEDLPFDERLRQSSGKKRRESSTLRSGMTELILPNMIDDVEDARSTSEGSEETSNSEQVLEDLDKLSKFMLERKWSSKGKSSTGSSRRRRKGGANMAISGGARRGGSGKRVVGRNLPTNYLNPSRGL